MGQWGGVTPGTWVAGQPQPYGVATRWKGAPDWDDPRRCQSKRNHRRWAVKPSQYCQYCGGRAAGRPGSAVSLRDLPVFYSKRLRGTLAEAVEQALGVHPDEQVTLYEELAITRVVAGEALELWSKARELPAENPRRLELVSAAEGCVRNALAEVRVMCESAARVREKSPDQISVHNLHYAVNQIVRISYEVLGGEAPELAQKFEEMIRQHLRLAREERPGTDLLPGGDEEVRMMDMTVPAS